MTSENTLHTNLIQSYVALTKPKIILMLLFTALGGLFLASSGVPDMTTTLVVLAGGTLASAGANALNQFFDRDIDEAMTRTSNRPVVSGAISPTHAVAFGIIVHLIAFIVFLYFTNLLSAALTLSATLFYVFVYTLGLKRTSHQNIVIGGAAGAIPPMVGWTAVTGSLGLAPIYLFAIVFFWTPPHFWALALMLKDDYAKANVPMLPVVLGVKETKKAILLYTILMLALTTMFYTTGAVGMIYLITSFLAGVVFITYAWRLWRQPDILSAKPLYLYSLLYIALIFLGIMLDSLIKI